MRLRVAVALGESSVRVDERTDGGSEGGKQSGSGGLLPCARAVVSGWWSEQSSGVGEFAVLVVRYGWCVVGH